MAGRKNVFNESDIQTLISFRQRGFSVHDISGLMGVSTTTIYRYLREYEESTPPQNNQLLCGLLKADVGAKNVDTVIEQAVADLVNHPPHYERGPVIDIGPDVDDAIGDGGGTGDPVLRTVQHIEVFRHIKDPRLATAFKYVWRVSFGGKDDDREDIEKAIFYLQDWLDYPVS